MKNLQKEEWRIISGYPDYEVSNLGRVRSNYGRSVDRILDGSILNNGYIAVGIVGLDGKKRDEKIHKLVAVGFLDHQPSKMEVVVNHRDNNQLNNCVDNLELVSQQENSRQHKKDVGVGWNNKSNKWKVRCSYPKSKEYFLGLYSDKQQAQQVSDLAYQLIIDGLTEDEWIDYLNQDGVTSRKRKISR